MYRQYENAKELEKELEKRKVMLNKAFEDGADFDDVIELKQYIDELEDRINFAYQDEEYDEMFYDYYGGGEIEDFEGWY